MTTDTVFGAAYQLQIETYLELGLATPGSHRIDEPAFQACVGPVDHPICNFAACHEIDPWIVSNLVDLAISREAFNLYVPNSEDSRRNDARHQMLQRAGFEHSFNLMQMVSSGRPLNEPVELRKAMDVRDRKNVCGLMSTIFFQQQSALFKRRIVDATVNSQKLELHSAENRNELVGALMLSRSEKLVGLFNLCVRSSCQGQGWGRGMVSAVQKMAYDREAAVTLQCDRKLMDWYEHQGFHKTGVIDVYVLPRARRIAIMN